MDVSVRDVLMLVVATAMTGCASTPTTTTTTAPTTPTVTTTPTRAPGAAPQFAVDTVALPRASTPIPAPAPVEAAAPVTGAIRRASLLGLYGELESNGTDATEPFDGSSNFAQISFATEGECFDPDVDRTGSWLVFASTMHRPTADIYSKPVGGKVVTQLTTDPANDVMPAISPDGKRVAFCSDRAGNWDIYVMSIDGGQPTQITSDTDHDVHPSWSPDGTMIAYCKLGSQTGRWEIWIVEAQNPGVRHFLDYGLYPQWCPDVARSKILFQRARQRGSRYFSVWTLDYRNGDAQHPTEVVSAANAAIINPSWSPDGSRVVFVTVVEPDAKPDMPLEQSDIWIINLDGTNRTNLTNGKFANFQPVWSNDGRVFFVSNRSGVDNVWAVTTGRAIDGQPGEAATMVGVDAAQQHTGTKP